MGFREWMKNYIRHTDTGKEIAQEEWNKAVKELKSSLLIIDEDFTTIRDCDLTPGPGKTGILIRSPHTTIIGCRIHECGTGVGIWAPPTKDVKAKS